MSNRCKSREDDGGETDHCIHVDDNGEALICCWCGDLFEPDAARPRFEHGEYASNAEGGSPRTQLAAVNRVKVHDLTAELDAMRPVVDAAVAQYEYNGILFGERLASTINAYRKAKAKP